MTRLSTAWTVQSIASFTTNPPSSPTKKYERGDRPGFCVQVTPNGTVTPYLHYTWGGKRPFLKLGEKLTSTKDRKVVGKWLTAARKAADAALALLAESMDPKDAIEAQKAIVEANKELGTARKLFDCYFEAYAAGRNKKGRKGKKLDRQVSRAKRDIYPIIDGLKAHEVTDAHILKVIRRPMERCKGTEQTGAESAADLWALCSAAFNFGLKFDNNSEEQEIHNDLKFKIMHNPAARVPNPKRGQARNRYLNEEEIRRAWAYWSECQDRRIGACLKMILLTGQRVNEISGMRWDEIDGELLVLPSERTKNGLEHSVVLTPMMTEILDEMRYLFGDDTYVFPVQGRHGMRGLEDKQVLLGVGDTIKATGVAHFQTRDLRRTWKTHNGRLKVDINLRDRMQNQAIAGVGSKHYDRWEYIDEKREVMQAWSDDLLRIVTTDPDAKVVAIR